MKSVSRDIAFYILLGVIVIVMKLLHAGLATDNLVFLLEPADKIFAIFASSPSEYIAGSGFYHRDLDIVIDKSCSGFNLWIISFSMLYLFVLLHDESFRRRVFAFFLLLPVSLAFTITVNAFRLIAAASLSAHSASPLLHEAVGILNNLFFLILLWLFAEHIMRKGKPNEKPA